MKTQLSLTKQFQSCCLTKKSTVILVIEKDYYKTWEKQSILKHKIQLKVLQNRLWTFISFDIILSRSMSRPTLVKWPSLGKKRFSQWHCTCFIVRFWAIFGINAARDVKFRNQSFRTRVRCVWKEKLVLWCLTSSISKKSFCHRK